MTGHEKEKNFEKEILESYDKDEWESLENLRKKSAEYAEYAAASTLRKDKRINIRISDNDLTGLKVTYSCIPAIKNHSL
jgi:predicted DNA binding CopG/RHH family protein